MSELFLTFVNMSISAGWVVLAVLLLRLILKKSPKWITVLLWGIVAIRLVCPFSIESALSLIPTAETFSPDILIDRTPHIDTGFTISNSLAHSILSDAITPEAEEIVNPLQIIIPILSVVWLLGIIILLIYTSLSYWRLYKKVNTAVLLKDNIYQSENVVSPFVLGVIKPKIYLPFDISEQDMEMVIAHEKAHLKRKDHLWKPFGFILLSLHWFNPIMWLSYKILCKDIELACDEKVAESLSNEQRADYSQALLNCSVNRRMILACPLAFGEVGVEDRVKSVLNYKKPAFWIVVVAIIALTFTGFCSLTNPKTNNISILNEDLQLFLNSQVEERCKTDDDENIFFTSSFEIMDVEETDAEITVYAWILSQEYSCNDGILCEESGSHTPTVITVKKNGNNYELLEYWEPLDGEYYIESIKSKFPKALWSKVLYTPKSLLRQESECEKMANEHFNISDSPLYNISAFAVNTTAYFEPYDEDWFDYYRKFGETEDIEIIAEALRGTYNMSRSKARKISANPDDYMKLSICFTAENRFPFNIVCYKSMLSNHPLICEMDNDTYTEFTWKEGLVRKNDSNMLYTSILIEKDDYEKIIKNFSFKNVYIGPFGIMFDTVKVDSSQINNPQGNDTGNDLISAMFMFSEGMNGYWEEQPEDKIYDMLQSFNISEEQKQMIVDNPDEYGLYIIETSVKNKTNQNIRADAITFEDFGYVGTDLNVNLNDRIIKAQSEGVLYDRAIIDTTKFNEFQMSTKSYIYFNCSDDENFDDHNELVVVENHNY